MVDGAGGGGSGGGGVGGGGGGGWGGRGGEGVDGAKREARASGDALVGRKTGEGNRAKLQEKMRVLLQQIDEEIVKDKAAETEVVESTPEALT